MRAAAVTFLYCVLVGTSWASLFKKRFGDSLAPALLSHAILVMLSGMVFHRLSFGIFGGIAAAAIILLIHTGKTLHEGGWTRLREDLLSLWGEGLLLLVIFFAFCWIINKGKEFTAWDEYSHWGIFLKESLRLDDLYAVSPLDFFHKDYVPLVTLFEVIWCRLAGRYLESDAYRGIQVFMFALMLPMFRLFELRAENGIKRAGRHLLQVFGRLLPLLGAFFLVLLVPILFNTSNAFYFYRSIYCDYAAGVMIFYCMYEAYKEDASISYQILVMTVGLSALILTKMTMAAFFPMIFAFFAVRLVFFSRTGVRKKQVLQLSFPLLIPPAFWLFFNRFADHYVTNKLNIQSYDAIHLRSLLAAFQNPEISPIRYLEEVRRVFIGAVFSKDILLHGSYAVSVGAVVVLFFILAYFMQEKIDRRKAVLTGIWVLLAAIANALIMYMLYVTQFSEGEAKRLASFERYMNSFVVGIVLLLLAAYFSSGLWENMRKGYCILIAALAIDLFFVHAPSFTQVVPGTLTHDDEINEAERRGADLLLRHTSETDKIYVLTRNGDGGYSRLKIWYYSLPHLVEGDNIGGPTSDVDRFYKDLSKKECRKLLKGYDYFYTNILDAAFIEKYESCFDNPDLLAEKTLYRVEAGENKKIHLAVIDSASKYFAGIEDPDIYLKALKNSGYTALISICDEGTKGLTDVLLSDLSALGIQTSLAGQTRKSYYAFIEDGLVKEEQLGEGEISCEGYFRDHLTTYKIISAGYTGDDATGFSSVKIDGAEKDVNKRGLNIVVYDPVHRVVVDSVSFDTYKSGRCRRS